MSNLDINEVLLALQAAYGEAIQLIGEGSQAALLIAPDQMLDVFGVLKTNEFYQFNMLRNLTAVDYLEYMEIVYHLYSLPLRHSITIKVRCTMEELTIPSVTKIWPSANFQEREIYDLLGVNFTGHPDLRRILMPEEFTEHPLRKTYNFVGNTGEKR
jgi:NADH-quinone oxidoreductase subunit C